MLFRSQADMTPDFIPRHIGPNASETSAMLHSLGANSLDEFIDKAVPAKIRSTRVLNLPEALSEREALSAIRKMANKNEVYTSMIGMGYYGTTTPKVVLRNVLENPGWYTAYTPYQAEVSQGRLEALLNFQQVVIDLTGLEIAYASLLDEATAAAEAMAMAKRVAKSSANVFFVDVDTHPQTIAVLQTRAKGFGIDIEIGDPLKDLKPAKVFAALLSYPGSSGALRDFTSTAADLHGEGAFAIMATDLLALALLKSPGELGADIAIGSAQRFGVPMGYGGPHAAFFATKDEYKRVMPGRLIGVSVDAQGNRALRMALQTREQHIRRDKATSNICTAQVLLSVMASMYAVYHGPEGVKTIAAHAHECAARFAAALKSSVVNETFFDTVTVRCDAEKIIAAAKAKRINMRLVDVDHVAVSFDETTREDDLQNALAVFGAKPAEASSSIPQSLRDRKSVV